MHARTAGRRATHPRKVLLLTGCVQPAMMPNINSATARVLDAAGIQTLVADDAGCCGAIRLHLNDRDGALDRHAPQHRRLVAAGRRPRQAGRGDRDERLGLRRDGEGIRPRAGARPGTTPSKARRIGELTNDLSELLPELVPALRPRAAPATRAPRRLAYHPPCTLQHGQQLRGGVEAALRALGFEVAAGAEREPPVLRLGRHLLGAAARARLRAARPQARQPRAARRRRPSSRPTSAASSTCRRGTTTPVPHWVEVLDAALHG